MRAKTAMMAGGVVLGLLLGGVLMGRAGAQQPAASAPVRYQYKCVTKAAERIWTADATNMLNAEGAQGWRLLENRPIFPTGYSDVYCFERRY